MGPDGELRTYTYHRLSRVRIYSDPGTPEFGLEYDLACEGHKTLKGRKLIAARREKAPRVTNIYFLRAKATGLIKIGRSENVSRRVAKLQTGSSEPLELIGSIRDSSGGLLETAIHRDFAAARVRGEWFAPDPALLDFITTRAA